LAAQAGEDGFPDDQHYTEGQKPKKPENKVGSVHFDFLLKKYYEQLYVTAINTKTNGLLLKVLEL